MMLQLRRRTKEKVREIVSSQVREGHRREKSRMKERKMMRIYLEREEEVVLGCWMNLQYVLFGIDFRRGI